MAQIGMTYTDLRGAIATAPIGTSYKGFTLTARVYSNELNRQFNATIERANNVWTVLGFRNAEGSHLIISVTDQQGRQWWPDMPEANGWR